MSRKFMVCRVVSVLVSLIATISLASVGRDVQDRLDADLAAGHPVVVHVVAVLCDNVHQGIVPVPESLGNGQDPRTNLYWGAMYGIKTHFVRNAGWVGVDIEPPSDGHVLERTVFSAVIGRDDAQVPVHVVADAWDGAHMEDALRAFFRLCAGGGAETVVVPGGSDSREIGAGGAAHLVAFVGHNGLMEYAVQPSVPDSAEVSARSALVLACASKNYFLPHLRSMGAHPLMLTTGLMAPEAYTLDSAIRAWVETGNTDAVLEAAAEAYDRYQQCGLRGARNLFWGVP
jgi:hypothetical protein